VWLSDRQLGNASISGPGADTWSKLTEAWPQPQTFTQQYRSLFAFWNVKDQIKTDLDLVIPQSGYEVDGITTWVITQFLPFYIFQASALKLIYAKGSRRLWWCLFRIRMAILVLRLRPMVPLSMAHNTEGDKKGYNIWESAPGSHIYGSFLFVWKFHLGFLRFIILWYESCLIYPQNQIEASSTRLAIIPAGTPLLPS
jgi:hypothetical protein